MAARPIRRFSTAATAALALAAVLSACGPAEGFAAGRTGAVAVAAPAGSGETAANTVDPDETSTTTGAVTASITSPVAVSGTASRPVSCISGRVYRASVTSAVIHGDQVSFTVAVTGYRGPGSYPAVVGATLTQPSGVVTTVAGVSRVPVVLTGTGGSFTVKATGTGGRTFAGSLSWTCGS